MSKEQKAAADSPFKLAGSVASQVDLVGVYLKSARVDSSVDPTTPIQSLESRHQSRFRSERNPEKDRLDVFIQFQLELVNGDDVAFSIEAEYRAVYRLSGSVEIAPEAQDAFDELNGTLHLWPYWRELVHTATARAGLGAIVVPVYRAIVGEKQSK
jgi:hypothetical protein